MRPLLFLPILASVSATPLLTSWHIETSGRYARLFETTADESASQAVTTWSRGQGIQDLPTYAGIHEISHTSEDVYVRTTGLGSHIMGPWYLNEGKTNLFPNYPANQAIIYRIPKDPRPPPPTKSLTGLGRIGIFVDGVSMFDSRDAFSYDTSAGIDETPMNTANGDGVWNRDAWINEGVTFDAANAHQARSNYHYHANPPALRHQLGDSVDYDPVTNRYTENFNGSHSPILAWVSDGYPLYGPYGYANSNDPSSAVIKMRSGFQTRTLTQRQTLPAYAARNQNRSATLSPNQYGPDVNAQFQLGHYLEDYEYLGDLGQTQGSDFDLDEHNGRFCITPEFPEGTYAYFVSIESDGTPKFPYNIGRTFYGNPTGDIASNIPANAIITFQGGPEKALSPQVSQNAQEITLTWDTVEGGTYLIEKSETLKEWQAISGTHKSDQVETTRPVDQQKEFYRATRLALAEFDDRGYIIDDQSERPKNNILLIIVDDWGIDSSPLDNLQATSHATMPTLSMMAEQGIRFTNAYAQPTCSPTRANILTGRYSFRHGIGSPGGANLPEDEFTLPEAFAQANSPYALSAIGKWHLGGEASGPNILGGWPDFRGTLNAGVDSYTNWSKTINGITTPEITTYTTTDQVNDTISFIQSQPTTQPWLCWLALNAPHSPLDEPPSELIRSGSTGGGNRGRYERLLEAMDTELENLLSVVDLETTNIILLGDNGTPGNVLQPPYVQGRAKGSLYEGGIRVPFLALGPDVRARGTSNEAIHCADIYATILDLAGITLPENTDSRSLFPAFNGTNNLPGGVVLENFGTGVTDPGRAIRIGEYKLILYDDGREEFYHVTADPTELNNLLDDTLSPEEQAAYDLIQDRQAELNSGKFMTEATGILSIAPANSPPGETVTLTINLDPSSSTPIVPVADRTIASIVLGGIPGTAITRPSRYVAQATFVLPNLPEILDLEIIFTGPEQRTFGLQNAYTVTSP